MWSTKGESASEQDIISIKNFAYGYILDIVEQVLVTRLIEDICVDPTKFFYRTENNNLKSLGEK